MSEGIAKSIIEGTHDEVLDGEAAVAEVLNEFNNLILRGDKLKDSFNVMATREEGAGNLQLVSILRAIANELVPLVQDAVDVSKYSFTAVVGMEDEEEEGEGEEGEEGEGGGVEISEAEVTALYKMIRMARSFLDGLSSSGLVKRGKARAALDNLMSMLKEFEVQGTAAGFLPDAKELEVLGEVKDSFK